MSDFEDVMGYGKKVKVFCGDKDGQPDIREFHFTPVSLKDLPELQGLLEKFFEITGEKAIGDQEAIEIACEIIHMSIKKMHSEIKVEEISEMFSLGGVAKVVSIVMDMNDFLAQMGEIQKLAKPFQENMIK